MYPFLKCLNPPPPIFFLHNFLFKHNLMKLVQEIYICFMNT